MVKVNILNIVEEFLGSRRRLSLVFSGRHSMRWPPMKGIKEPPLSL
jgi:hypothetical protein